MKTQQQIRKHQRSGCEMVFFPEKKKKKKHWLKNETQLTATVLKIFNFGIKQHKIYSLNLQSQVNWMWYWIFAFFLWKGVNYIPYVAKNIGLSAFTDTHMKSSHRSFKSIGFNKMLPNQSPHHHHHQMLHLSIIDNHPAFAARVAVPVLQPSCLWFPWLHRRTDGC